LFENPEFVGNRLEITSHRIVDFSRKEGKTNGLHHFPRTNGDGDVAVHACNPLPGSRSPAIGTQPGSATSPHELGRGHRQKRQPCAAYEMVRS
jgi:hypothetical protein